MLLEFSPYELLAIQIVVLVGALVQGSVGFGFSLISVPFLALIDLHFIPGPVICAATILSVLTAGRELSSVDFRGITWAVAGRVPGIVLAILTLHLVSDFHLKVIVGLLVCVAVWLSLRGHQVTITRKSLAGAGLISGFMGTTAAIGGPPLALLFQYKPADYLRGTLAGYFIISAVMSLTALAIAGLFGPDHVVSSVLLLPGTIIGFALSGPAKKNISPSFVRMSVLLVSGAAGSWLVLRSFFF